MEKIRDIHDYGDIIDLPRPISTKHQPMNIADRAAQFAPFAVLDGYEGVIEKAAREKETAVDGEMELLDEIALFGRDSGADD